MAMPNTYAVSASFTPGAAANTVFQIATTAAKPIEIFRLEVTEQGSATSAQMGLTLNQVNGAASVWATSSPAPKKLNPSDNAASSTVTAYTSGTTTDGASPVVILQSGFNVLSGYLYLPVPEERIIIPVSQWFTVKFVVAPPAATVFNINCVYRELG